MINVRVYGVLINEKKQVLVSDELIRGMKITKFCGGGLEFGEGTIDCVIREFREEMNVSVKVKQHLYTTDFFQESAFNKEHQILSIYYEVEADSLTHIEFSTNPFEFSEVSLEKYKNTQQAESFRFIDIDQYSESCMSLPIDKIVAKLIIEKEKNYQP
jgi:8-oxo-dGTP diphosphatase